MSPITKERRGGPGPGDQRARGLTRRASDEQKGVRHPKGSELAGTVELDGIGRTRATVRISWPSLATAKVAIDHCVCLVTVEGARAGRLRRGGLHGAAQLAKQAHRFYR